MGIAVVSTAVFGVSARNAGRSCVVPSPKTFTAAASSPIVEAVVIVRLAGETPARATGTVALPNQSESFLLRAGFASSLAQHCPEIETGQKGNILQVLEYQHGRKLDRPQCAAGTTDAATNAENRFMRYMFYIRYYVVPPASFGIFVAAEALFLYGLYRAFVAP